MHTNDCSVWRLLKAVLKIPGLHSNFSYMGCNFPCMIKMDLFYSIDKNSIVDLIYCFTRTLVRVINRSCRQRTTMNQRLEMFLSTAITSTVM